MPPINRRQFMSTIAASVTALSTPNFLTANETIQLKPNIIYINIDDLGWTDLGCQGSDYYETPNIDKLATQGVVFTNAYAPAANCAPSRACCLTGQYTPRHGIYTVNSSSRGKSKDRKLIPVENTHFISDDNLTIAHALKKAGYITCTIGKWHISSDPIKNGFDVNFAGCEWGHPKNGYFSPYNNPKLKDGPEGEYLTDRLTTQAIEFIKKNSDKPFFLYFPFYSVHTPIQPKKEKKKKFAKKAPTEAHKNAGYAAMIESVDENVGRVIAALDQTEISDNTLVLFTSDNGGVWKISKQWPLRAGKGSYYEGGIRAPMIVRWPGKIKPGGRCDTPVSGIDFFPTLLDAANIEKPDKKELDGISLMPLFTQKGSMKKRPLFWHFPIYLGKGNNETTHPKFRTRPGSVVRYGDWKLHEYFEDMKLELYNLKDDPGEKKNLADKETDIVEKLHQMLKKWRQKIKAPIPTQINPEYDK